VPNFQNEQMIGVETSGIALARMVAFDLSLPLTLTMIE